MALNGDTQQGIRMGLSAVNVSSRLSFLLDATVSGANTYATLRSRVSGNINAATVAADNKQAGNNVLLHQLDLANQYGILTDTNLNGLTTVAGVQALFTAQDSSLPAGYALNLGG